MNEYLKQYIELQKQFRETHKSRNWQQAVSE